MNDKSSNQGSRFPILHLEENAFRRKCMYGKSGDTSHTSALKSNMKGIEKY
jgi:hypothetical protein